MNFLEKLDTQMAMKNLTKAKLAKQLGIPYTTIDSWYKLGYEGIRFSTLRLLTNFFGVTLGYWIDEEELSEEEMELINKYRNNVAMHEAVHRILQMDPVPEKETSK